MLKLKHSHHFLPHLTVSVAPMAFQPVEIKDDDELSQAIVNDPVERDDTWTLTERPDMGQLSKFWSDVESDVENDPEWFKFSEE